MSVCAVGCQRRHLPWIPSCLSTWCVHPSPPIMDENGKEGHLDDHAPIQNVSFECLDRPLFARFGEQFILHHVAETGICAVILRGAGNPISFFVVLFLPRIGKKERKKRFANRKCVSATKKKKKKGSRLISSQLFFLRSRGR